MLIEDGGGGYGGTDWSAMDVVAMWQAIENQDTNPHWQMLSGWRKSYELTLQHLAQVKNYRDNLATAWPPEKSPASAAYLTRLDQLIESLQATYDAAVANYGAFSGATAALATSRSELKKIYDAYVANQAKLADFRAKASRPVGGKALAPPAKPPVTDAQQEQLNNQARAIMYGLSSEIIQARSTLTTPKIYDATRAIDHNSELVGTNAFIPPPIPPILPAHSDLGAPGGSHMTTHAAPHAIQSPVPSSTTGSSPGLVLGGVSPGSVFAPPSVAGPPPIPPSSGLTPNGIVNPTPVLPTTSVRSLPLGTTPTTTTGAVRGSVGGDGVVRTGTGTLGGPSRALPPGGIIGAVPSVGAGQSGAGVRSTQRINPVGGVIGGAMPTGLRGQGLGQPSRPTTHTGQFIGPGGQRRVERRDGDGALRWDPDNPWETAEGIAPVVLPAGRQRVDPGPAIGLS